MQRIQRRNSDSIATQHRIGTAPFNSIARRPPNVHFIQDLRKIVTEQRKDIEQRGVHIGNVMDKIHHLNSGIQTEKTRTEEYKKKAEDLRKEFSSEQLIRQAVHNQRVTELLKEIENLRETNSALKNTNDRLETRTKPTESGGNPLAIQSVNRDSGKIICLLENERERMLSKLKLIEEDLTKEQREKLRITEKYKEIQEKLHSTEKGSKIVIMKLKAKEENTSNENQRILEEKGKMINAIKEYEVTIRDLSARIGHEKNTKFSLQKHIEENKKNIENLTEKSTADTHLIRYYEEENLQFKQKISELTEEPVKVSQSYNNLLTQYSFLQSTVESQATTISALQTDSESLRGTISSLQNENESLRGTISTLQTSSRSLRSTVSSLQNSESQFLSLQLQYTILQQSHQDTQSSYTEQLAQYESEIEALQSQLEPLPTKDPHPNPLFSKELEDYKSRITGLEFEVLSLKQSKLTLQEDASFLKKALSRYKTLLNG